VQADLSGDYLQIARFINELERDKLFYIVDGVQLGSSESGTVRLQITVETYLRTT